MTITKIGSVYGKTIKASARKLMRKLHPMPSSNPADRRLLSQLTSVSFVLISCLGVLNGAGYVVAIVVINVSRGLASCLAMLTLYFSAKNVIDPTWRG